MAERGEQVEMCSEASHTELLLSEWMSSSRVRRDPGRLPQERYREGETPGLPSFR